MWFACWTHTVRPVLLLCFLSMGRKRVFLKCERAEGNSGSVILSVTDIAVARFDDLFCSVFQLWVMFPAC